MLNRWEQRCRVAAQAVAAVAVACMLALSFVICADVVLRDVTNVPILGLDEAMQLMMAVIITATFPAGVAARNHITVDFLEGFLARRTSAMLTAIGGALLLGFMTLLAWRFGVYAGQLAARHEMTAIVRIPVAPFWWTATALLALCVPIQAIVFANQLREAIAAPRTAGARARLGTAIAAVSLLATAVAVLAVMFWGARLGTGGLAGVALAALWIPILVGMPVGATMGLIGLVGAGALMDWSAALTVFALQPAGFLTNLNLAALPLFLMMGSFAAVAGLSTDVYRLAHALLSAFRGGLAMATIGGCAGFGAVTGSSVATAATIGRVALPEMQARGYSPALATGCCAAGGTLGNLVPPGSGPIIVFALLTEASIGQLFIASVGPAILAVMLYLATIWLFVTIRPAAAPERAAPPPGELVSALKASGPVFLLFFAVLGGLYVGLFTATESAAVGAAITFVVALARGKLRRAAFLDVMAETTATTAIIYSLIFGALVFSFFTGISGVAESLTKWITGLGWQPLAVIALLLAIYVALGTFMESYTVMIVTLPMVTPLILGMGYDIIWWGIIMLCVVETGNITPPFGLNMFVLKSVGDVPISTVFAGVLPFVAADVVKLAILVLIPAISLWLPSTMFD